MLALALREPQGLELVETASEHATEFPAPVARTSATYLIRQVG